MDKHPDDLLKSLFEAHHHRLRRWVMDLVGRKAIAEEIVQETYLTVFRHYGHADITSPWALLVDIAQNKAVDYLRRGLHETGTAAPAVDEIPEESLPDRLAEHQEMSKRLKDVIENLSPALRQVMVMRFFDQLSRQEIAVRVNISVGAVEQRITRALSACRSALQAWKLVADGESAPQETRHVSR